MSPILFTLENEMICIENKYDFLNGHEFRYEWRALADGHVILDWQDLEIKDIIRPKMKYRVDLPLDLNKIFDNKIYKDSDCFIEARALAKDKTSWCSEGHITSEAQLQLELKNIKISNYLVAVEPKIKKDNIKINETNDDMINIEVKDTLIIFNKKTGCIDKVICLIKYISSVLLYLNVVKI